MLASIISAILGNPLMRLGGLPVGAVVLTAACRRVSACRHEATPRRVLSFETIDVGIDLLILAVLTALTSALEAASRVASLNNDEVSSAGPRAHVAAAVLSALHRQLQAANDQEIASGAMAGLALLVLLFTSMWISNQGYQVPKAVRDGVEPMLTKPAARTRKGIILGLVVGLVTFVFVLITVAPH